MLRTGSPSTVVVRTTVRSTVRMGLGWGIGSGLVIASSAVGFRSTYPTAAARSRFAGLFAGNAGLDAINGPADRLATVAGYTQWKTTMFLVVAGAVIGLRASARLLRGEEDAGRWELLLSGATTRARSATQALAAIAVGLCVWCSITAVMTIVVGQGHGIGIDAGRAVLFAVATTSGAAMFAAVGAVAGELAPSRRRADGYAGIALAIAYGLRMLADSAPSLEWLRWATPIGWIEQLEPLTSPHLFALVPIGVFTMAALVLAIRLAGARDLGDGFLHERDERDRLGLLGGALALDVRLERRALLIWTSVIAALAVLMGLIAKAGGEALTASRSIAEATGRLGDRGGDATAYLGVTFLIVAVLLAAVVVTELGATRAEESSVRLDTLLAGPVARLNWLAGRIAVATGAVLGIGAIAGGGAWVGESLRHEGLGATSLLAAGVNAAAPALCVLGCGVLAYGLWPRRTTPVMVAVIGWSFVIEVIGGAMGLDHWIVDTSVFRAMSPSPAVPVDWLSAGVLAALGALGAAVGAAAFARRDLVPD